MHCYKNVTYFGIFSLDVDNARLSAQGRAIAQLIEVIRMKVWQVYIGLSPITA